VQAAPRPPRQDSLSTAPAPAEAPPILCASNVAELRQSVADAFASRDPNRLAGLMLWGGSGRNAAVADIRALGALMQRPLLDFGEDTQEAPAPAAAPSADSIYDLDKTPSEPDKTVAGGGGDTGTLTAAARAPASAVHQLVLHTAANDGSGIPHETRFAIVRRSGCLWLRNDG
jgi:hypothetical protein